MEDRVTLRLLVSEKTLCTFFAVHVIVTFGSAPELTRTRKGTPRGAFFPLISTLCEDNLGFRRLGSKPTDQID